MSPSLTAHLAAINSGQVERGTVIGIRKQINAMEKGEAWRGSWRDKMPDPDDVFAVEEALMQREPRVGTQLALSGIKQLSDRRYRKRFTDAERAIIENLDVFRLVGFQRIGRAGVNSTAVYRAVGENGDSFLFVNVPWQQAFSDSTLVAGPSVITREDF